MKVLVIGSMGSMGRRYCAILKFLGVEHVGIDRDDSDFEWNSLYDSFDVEGCTHAIIATPTEKHYENIIWALSKYVKNVLCEKPVDKDPGRIQRLDFLEKQNRVDIRMVCNYKYAFGDIPISERDIEYSNYNTGKDGTGWDCIQLIYLAKKLTINTELPFFKCQYTDPECNCKKEITLHDVEISYINMIRHWLKLQNRENNLWDLNDALKATEKVIKWKKANE